MCGIIGHLSIGISSEKDWLIDGSNKMIHRGPDNGGYFKSGCSRVEFGQRRLSILDLSKASNQPFIIEHKGFEYAITFNGEIYNYLEVRLDLVNSGVVFLTDSDTEVILRSYIAWGEECLQHFEGMFSFAIYDSCNHCVFLARDIIGEKPLYYAYFGNELYFASEFLPLHSHSKFENKINLSRIYEYLELGYLPNDSSFSNKIKKLNPGSYLFFELRDGRIINKSYSDIKIPKTKLFEGDKLDKFNCILNDVIDKELRSDVPVGVMLSGGIDSSIIACKCNERASNVTNFTVDFGDNLDELKNAKLISKKYQVKHEILQFQELDLETFDKIISRVDEPIADSSFIPTYLITEMIKASGCTVVLGGDGADEIFGGYSIYSNWKRVVNISNKLPLNYLSSTINLFNQSLDFNDSRILKWLKNLDFKSPILPNIRSVYTESELRSLFKNFHYQYGSYYSDEMKSLNLSTIENLMMFDLFNYFSSNILLKNDRSSMLNSIELRAPFLHKSIIQFGFENLTIEDKIDTNNTKIFLKSFSKELFPNGYLFHTKRGFNFTDNLIKNKKWEDYFSEKLSYLSSILSWNDEMVEKLIKLNKEKKINFVKIYSLVILSNWISNNQFLISE